MKKACVLSSGGMDSFLLWKLFAPEARQVFVNIRQPYIVKELDAMWAIRKFTGADFDVLEATRIGEGEAPNGIILHRNALLILTAATYYSEILMGVLADEINSDKSPEFFSAMETVLNISHRGQYWNNGVGVEYTVHSPIRSYTKSALVAKYMAAGHAVEPLLATVSCYSAMSGQCGACPSCFKRWVALVNNGIQQKFKSDPLLWAHSQGIIKKATDGTYGKARAQEIMNAVNRGAGW